MVSIEEADRDQRCRKTAAGRLNGATNDRGRQDAGDDDRKIAHHERVPRQRLCRVADRDTRVGEPIQVQLSDQHAIVRWQAARVRDRGRHLADHAQRRAARTAVTDDDRGRVSRNERRMARGFELDGYAADAAHAFDNALEVEEVRLAAAAGPVFGAGGSRPCDRDTTRLAVRRETGPDLEQSDVASAVTAILPDGIDQPRQQGGSQRIELARQRVGDRNEGSPLRTEELGGFCFDEPECHRFRQPGRCQDAPDELIARDTRIGRRRGRHHRRKRRLQTIEAVVPPDFFNEVRLAEQINPKRRRANVPPVACAFNREAKARQDAHNVSVGNRCAEDPRQPFAPQVQRSCPARIRIAIDSSAGERAGADLFHQRGCALNGDDLRTDVGATFEPGRGFGLESKALAGPSHRRRVEIRAFVRDALRCPRHLGGRAAHDARHRLGTIARLCAAHANLRARELLQIERVHRLPDLEIHIVGDVDDAADGPDAGGEQTVGHPLGSRPDRHVG